MGYIPTHYTKTGPTDYKAADALLDNPYDGTAASVPSGRLLLAADGPCHRSELPEEPIAVNANPRRNEPHVSGRGKVPQSRRLQNGQRSGRQRGDVHGVCQQRQPRDGRGGGKDRRDAGHAGLWEISTSLVPPTPSSSIWRCVTDRSIRSTTASRGRSTGPGQSEGRPVDSSQRVLGSLCNRSRALIVAFRASESGAAFAERKATFSGLKRPPGRFVDFPQGDLPGSARRRHD